MNKQELIKEFEEIGIYGLNMFGAVVKGIPTETAIDLIKQLDEPEAAKVPQCVADWIEKCKNNFGFNLKSAMNINTILHYSDDCHKMIDWIKVNSNQETFARAWLDGYEVEEEKRYLVKVKATKHYISKDGIGKIFFSLAYKESFTKKELEEANFGWVFDCEGIEIEEVEN